MSDLPQIYAVVKFSRDVEIFVHDNGSLSIENSSEWERKVVSTHLNFLDASRVCDEFNKNEGVDLDKVEPSATKFNQVEFMVVTYEPLI